MSQKKPNPKLTKRQRTHGYFISGGVIGAEPEVKLLKDGRNIKLLKAFVYVNPRAEDGRHRKGRSQTALTFPNGCGHSPRRPWSGCIGGPPSSMTCTASFGPVRLKRCTICIMTPAEPQACPRQRP